MNASDVVVTILTGRRPGLLADTLAAALAHAPGLLETAHVIALHNGTDEATADVLATHGRLFARRLQTPKLVDMGVALGTLAPMVTTSRRRWWLHLEDDWRCNPSPGWFHDARRILIERPDVAQVRLRRADEPVLARHMVTREPIRWRDHDGYRLAPDAHYTCNPSLVRAADACDAWPAPGERAAQRRWRDAGHRGVAQLVPGVFTHTGDDESLRLKTGMPL